MVQASSLCCEVSILPRRMCSYRRHFLALVVSSVGTCDWNQDCSSWVELRGEAHDWAETPGLAHLGCCAVNSGAASPILVCDHWPGLGPVLIPLDPSLQSRGMEYSAELHQGCVLSLEAGRIGGGVIPKGKLGSLAKKVGRILDRPTHRTSTKWHRQALGKC